MKILQQLHLQYALRAGLILMAIAYAPITGCAPQLYQPSNAHAAWAAEKYAAPVTVSGLEEGRTLYTQYCATCHYLHMPKEFTIAEWNTIYPVMADKLSVADSTRQKIMYYVMAGARDAGK